MLNSKNIHFALLGIILGSAAAYIYGSYQVEIRRQAEIEAAGLAVATEAAAHPEVSNEDMLAFFQEALAVSPNDPELISRYADFLFDLQRYSESAEWFGRALDFTPEDPVLRTRRATALYGSGRIDEAIQEFQRAADSDPSYTLALHNLVLAYLDAGNDIAAAEAAISRLERIDPAYPELPSLRERIDAARAN